MTFSYKYCVLFCLSILLLAGCSSSKTSLSNQIPPEVEVLKSTYPNHILTYKKGKIILANGTKVVFDDKKQKTHNQLINSADIQDIFSIKYPKGELAPAIAKNSDPGRYRNEKLLKAVYGKNEDEVKKKLVTISWCPKLVNQQLLVTTVNGVDKQFLKVSAELDEHPEWAEYLISAGTFNWRTIRGSKMLSAHCFGIAIDINTAYSSYWKKDYPGFSEDQAINGYQNQIPQGIIDIFEKHGFIWGGKWYHYDSMHFEYRPELLE